MRKNIYFPNLNGVRFIAAFLVIIFHIEQFKSLFGIPNYVDASFLHQAGKLGVILFFVLSGFLITYILLEEEGQTGKIHVRKFYIRRMLRIWPLYFLVVGLALLVLPNFQFFIVPGYEKEVLYANFELKAALYFTFFANLAVSMYNIFPYASQAWSIGTEEQFYLLWPLLIGWIKSRRMLIMVSVVLFYVGMQLLLNADLNFIPGKMYLRKFWKLFNIDCMAIGGFFAVALHQRKFLAVLLNNKFFYGAILLALSMMAFGVTIPVVNYEVYAIFFGIIILNFASNKRQALSLENKVLHYLGKISYGLYMYHILAIVVCIKLLLYAGVFSNWILYPAAMMLTILMASVSYEYFESFFIRKKKKYSDVVSGENVKEDSFSPSIQLSPSLNTAHFHSENHSTSHP